MKMLFGLLALVVLALCGGLYYQFFYPPSVMKRNTQAALEQFASAVETQDRSQISGYLETFLAEDAQIHLEVEFSLLNSSGMRPIVQDFDKASFITFIDNTLYSLSDYHYRPMLREFALMEEGNTAAITFTSGQWADGPSYYGGMSVMMRFSADGTCSGQTRFENAQPKLLQASCRLLLRSVPKSGQAELLQQSEGLRELLKQR